MFLTGRVSERLLQQFLADIAHPILVVSNYPGNNPFNHIHGVFSASDQKETTQRKVSQ